MASGISEDVESSDAIWEITRARLPWLLIGMIGGLFGAKVIGIFDIEKNYQMAFSFPSLQLWAVMLVFSLLLLWYKV